MMMMMMVMKKKMMKKKMHLCSCMDTLIRAAVLLLLMGLFIHSSVDALVVKTSGLLPCSKKCESKFCAFPPLLRYGKYCGVGYTGCDGEEPCDAIDVCCRTHDNCIGDNLSNYLNKTCNENLLKCVTHIQNSGTVQFKGATCGVKEVTTTIQLVMEVATHLQVEQQEEQP